MNQLKLRTKIMSTENKLTAILGNSDKVAEIMELFKNEQI